MRTVKTIKFIANFTGFLAIFSYVLLIGTLIYNFILAITDTIYTNATLALVFAILLCGFAYVFMDAADKVFREQLKALKDKQIK